MSILRIRSSYRVELLVAGLLVAFSSCRQQTPESQYSDVMLFGRPLQMDRSLIKEFSFKINGVDALNGHPKTAQRKPVHYTGMLVKNVKLQQDQRQSVFLARRRIEDGKADWITRPAEFNDETAHPTFPGDVIDFNRVERYAPGEYELRWYIVISSFDLTVVPKSYWIAQGRLTVEPAPENVKASTLPLSK